MKLKFGKYKGQQFKNTPKSYQNWLLKQDWFKAPEQDPLHKQLNGWDGHSRKGEAIYDAIFEQEKSIDAQNECTNGGTECVCSGSCQNW